MNKFKLGKDALTLAIMTLITILTWIGFDVYRVLTKTTITEVTQKQMTPLNPKIKSQTVEQIKENFWISEEEITAINFAAPESTKSTAAE